ncbi:MAG: hypothetical protein HQK84_02305 [Nitrospinae bacterium]|nr:hypothetical protein [Nitrospinota bacterium]
MLLFKPLFFKDKLTLINPAGNIAIVTLWSKVSSIHERLKENGVDLSEKSPIAVMGNLYGNGFRQMLRNLLYNPQINHLILIGQDLSNSKEDIFNFFQYGTEDFTENNIIYRRIVKSNRILDTHISRDLFSEIPRLTYCGLPQAEGSMVLLKECLKNNSVPNGDLKRLEVHLPRVEVSVNPSNPITHVISEDSPVNAWKELVFRLYTFGIPVELKKGKRKELLNVKVTVNNPKEDSEKELQEVGCSLEKFKKYQKAILAKEVPDGIAYSYGNRIRDYFGVDFIKTAIERLKKDLQDRHTYYALWDSRTDVLKGLQEGIGSAPCLVSLFFRYFQNKLTLTATFRTHNGMDAWLENLYGLMAIQKEVADAIDLSSEERGAITVISHSISLNMDDFERGKKVALNKKFSFKHDENGQIVITSEDDEIVAVHSNNQGIQIKEYRSKKAEKIQHDLYRDNAISDINHAMYIGSQLTLAEIAIKNKSSVVSCKNS